VVLFAGHVVEWSMPTSGFSASLPQTPVCEPILAAGMRCSSARAVRHGGNAADPAADLFALSGAAGFHPHAVATTCDGTMIRGTHLRRNGSVWLRRAPTRHSDRLSLAKADATPLAVIALSLVPRPPRQAPATQPRATIRADLGSIFTMGTMRPE
jgi:hypothetical protein